MDFKMAWIQQFFLLILIEKKMQKAKSDNIIDLSEEIQDHFRRNREESDISGSQRRNRRRNG